jgi:hypothetical protein
VIRRAGLAVGLLLVTVLAGWASNHPVTVEAFDSGTRVVREVAEALNSPGRGILECYPGGSWLFLAAISLLPENARISAMSWGMRLGVGHPAQRADDVRLDALATWCVRQYSGTNEKYPAILLGAPNGAVAHLAALLRVPFLTTSFCLTFRHPTTAAEDVTTQIQGAARLAATIADANPCGGYEIICHVDPIHDRPLVRFVHFVRVKLHEIPDCYLEFISARLAPGGTVILIDCDYRWPQYVLAERQYVQVGGLGAIRPEDYAEQWPVDLPIEDRRESEWGCPEPFAEDVSRVADGLDLDLVILRYNHPASYSLLAHKAFSACPGARADLLLIDSFNHFSPQTNTATGIPPLWLPFNTTDGIDVASTVIARAKPRRVFLIPLPSFAESPDTVPLDRWSALLDPPSAIELLGTTPKWYPADPLAPYRLHRDLKDLRRRFALEVPLQMELDDFLRVVHEGDVRCVDPTESLSLLLELRLAAHPSLR